MFFKKRPKQEPYLVRCLTYRIPKEIIDKFDSRCFTQPLPRRADDEMKGEVPLGLWFPLSLMKLLEIEQPARLPSPIQKLAGNRRLWWSLALLASVLAFAGWRFRAVIISSLHH